MKKKILPETIFQEAMESMRAIKSNSSEEQIKEAQNGLGFIAARFALRYIKPNANQDLYNKIYMEFWDCFKIKDNIE